LIWVGDDWAEDHHDIELLDDDGRRLARARLPEGLDGIARLHALIAEHMPASWADLEPAEAARRVQIGIETDRGTWVQALLAAGYQVYAINPMSVARYRERHSTSGAKSDAGDAHVLAEIVRLDHAHDPADAQGGTVASTAASAERLRGDRVQQGAAHQHPQHRDRRARAGGGLAFWPVLGARILGEFGDDPHRYTDAKARRNYAGTSPITRASGSRRVVLARYARNRRIADAVHQWVFCAMRGSPGARAYYQIPARAWHRTPSRPAPTRQPPRRHPPRLPQNRDPLRRGHRLGPSTAHLLTLKNMGCLPPIMRGRHAGGPAASCGHSRAAEGVQPIPSQVCPQDLSPVPGWRGYDDHQRLRRPAAAVVG